MVRGEAVNEAESPEEAAPKAVAASSARAVVAVKSCNSVSISGETDVKVEKAAL
jgi:hypothetical protein